MSDRRIPIADIQRVVAVEWRTPLAEMKSGRRDPKVARARQVAMALSTELTPHSLKVIGTRFGDRDHSTVSYARARIAELRRADPDFDAKIRRLTRHLRDEKLLSHAPEIQLDFLPGPLFDFLDRSSPIADRAVCGG